MSIAASRAGVVMMGALLSLSCGSDFPERSLITDLRILAVSADPPWVLPTQTSRLTPLVVGVEDPTQLGYRWSWCPLRGPNSSGYECLIPLEVLNATLQPMGFTVPADFYELGTNATADFNYLVTAEFVEQLCLELGKQEELSRFVTLPDCDEGLFPISVQLDVTLGDRIITAYKEVTLVFDLTTNRPLSALPDVSGLGIEVVSPNGNLLTRPIDFEEAVRVRLGPTLGDDGEPVAPLEQLDRLSEAFETTETTLGEDGTIISTTVQTREQLLLSWFSETGEWDANRTGFQPDTLQGPDQPDGIPIAEAWDSARANVWAAPLSGDFEAGETTRLYVVVRDFRGGTSWTTSTVAVGGL